MYFHRGVIFTEGFLTGDFDGGFWQGVKPGDFYRDFRPGDINRGFWSGKFWPRGFLTKEIWSGVDFYRGILMGELWREDFKRGDLYRVLRPIDFDWGNFDREILTRWFCVSTGGFWPEVRERTPSGGWPLKISKTWIWDISWPKKFTQCVNFIFCVWTYRRAKWARPVFCQQWPKTLNKWPINRYGNYGQKTYVRIWAGLPN